MYDAGQVTDHLRKLKGNFKETHLFTERIMGQKARVAFRVTQVKANSWNDSISIWGDRLDNGSYQLCCDVPAAQNQAAWNLRVGDVISAVGEINYLSPISCSIKAETFRVEGR